MKNKLWLIQVPVILLFACAFWVSVEGEEGKLHNTFLRESVFHGIRRITGLTTDLKFKLRGPEKTQQRIVILDVDDPTIEGAPHFSPGRWPWHRNYIAQVIEQVFALGAKGLALDIVFSERDPRIPPELEQYAAKAGLDIPFKEFDTDKVLESTIERHADKLVLGWTVQTFCTPRFQLKEEFCEVGFGADHVAEYFEKNSLVAFALNDVQGVSNDVLKRSVLTHMTYPLGNLPDYNFQARRAGLFSTNFSGSDSDGVWRRFPMVFAGAGRLFPSLTLAMASLAKDDEPQITLGTEGQITDMKCKKSGQVIPANQAGVLEANFRGGAQSYPYVSVVDLMSEKPTLDDGYNRKLANAPKADILKDALVFMGVSALGTNDIRNFPFENSVPGVEGHAHILDNLLSNDMLVAGSHTLGFSGNLWVFILMTGVAVLLAFAAQRLESIPALAIFLGSFLFFGFFDFYFLFKEKHINWNTGLVYIEFGAICFLTLAVKYIIEEHNKKFLKAAFSKYVSPDIVDRILEDPTKLFLGGEKRELSILFSDIRSFTSFSEKMDAKELSKFLNDYLGRMTDIVFEAKGTLDKYIGDAVMAFWGAPLDQKNHASNAAQAAIKMMKALRTHRVEYKKEFGIDVDIGIGVNTGAVSVGNMGCEKNFEYTVIGDHVNLASRLEGLTKYYGVSIVTTRFTLDQITAAGDTVPAHRTIDFVKVKGKDKAVELIQLFDQDLDPKGLQYFEEGRRLYVERKFSEASEAFTRAKLALVEDAPSEMYLERCAEYVKNPPDADWDGSHKMTSK